MTTTFNQNIPKGMKNDFSNKIADDSFTVHLSADTEQHFTVPGADAQGGTIGHTANYLAVFSNPQNKSISVSFSGTAVVPPSSVAKTGCALVNNGMGRYVLGGSTISMITHETTADLGIELFVINT